jgi:hypothetical protein
MSNTRKTRPIDHRQIAMAHERKKQKLRIRLQQENSQQRARQAREFAEKKLAEVYAKVANQEMSLTEAQAETIDILVDQQIALRPNHIHDDDGTVEGCPGCFPGPDVSDWNSPEDSVYDG